MASLSSEDDTALSELSGYGRNSVTGANFRATGESQSWPVSPPRVCRPTPLSPISRADMALRAGRYTIGVDAFGAVAWRRRKMSIKAFIVPLPPERSRGS